MTNPSLPVSRRRARHWPAWLALLVLLATACTTESTGDDDDDDEPNATCGNGTCDEAPATCPADCQPDVDSGAPACGNTMCEAGESNATCPSDCAVCGDQVCTGNEPSTCASDCVISARLVVRNTSALTAFYLYIARCGDTEWGPDRLGSNVISPGYMVTISGVPPGCYFFRAETSDRRTYWQTAQSVTLAAGQAYTWTLTGGQ